MKTKRLAFAIAAVLILPASTIALRAQDPTQESNVIKETLAKIREVEQLDKYIEENNTLKEQNKSLLQQLAELDKQVKALTQELQQQNEKMRKQLLQMPSFVIKSKVVGPDFAAAVLETGQKTIRIRNDLEMSVPVSDGVWILMRVENISKDIIQLHFPELDRTIYLYD